MSEDGSPRQASEQTDRPPDHEWFVLTEGLDPYERFRYIVRHVLETAVEDARDYVGDRRIFDEDVLEDEDASADHLRELDRRLREDGELSQMEREFMCAAVSRAMRERGMESRCYAELFKLARPAGDGSDDGSG